jgi:hypothetical protein
MKIQYQVNYEASNSTYHEARNISEAKKKGQLALAKGARSVYVPCGANAYWLKTRECSAWDLIVD